MDSKGKAIKQVKMVYFSGTGGTAKAADCFEKVFEAHGVAVAKCQLRRGQRPSEGKEDLLVVLYAVHACNAPEPVYEWISSLQKVKGMPAAVISVSGGGEIPPNTACRVSCIRMLEKKGYEVVYERMLVMPSNWIVPTVEPLAVRLLEVLPVKVEQAVGALLTGKRHRTKPVWIDRVFSWIGELEKSGGRMFGRKIKVNEACNGCGWCERSCPGGNIRLKDDRPVFGGECLLCLKCIYGCPNKALAPGTAKFIVVKSGYDLRDFEGRTSGVGPAEVESLAKGYLWKGVKDYLLDNDTQ